MNINTMNMKKYIAALFGAIALVASGCADYDSDIKRLERRIDEIESNQIKSIESQIKNINESLPKLEQTDKDLKGMISQRRCFSRCQKWTWRDPQPCPQEM